MADVVERPTRSYRLAIYAAWTQSANDEVREHEVARLTLEYFSSRILYHSGTDSRISRYICDESHALLIFQAGSEFRKELGLRHFDGPTRYYKRIDELLTDAMR